MRRRFVIADVFADKPLRGNPVAVILDAVGLDPAWMQRIAEWTNLSETTFVLPPTVASADYRLRIFTPRSELPFAGHPTLGTLHALRAHGLVADRQVYHQQCEAGLIRIECDTDGYHFRLPKPHLQALPPEIVSALATALGVSFDQGQPQLIDVGPRWVIARLANTNALRAVQPDSNALATLEREMGATGVTLFAADPSGGTDAIEVRSFAPSQGVPEDPVCGSGNGAVAIYRREFESLSPTAAYLSRQGFNVGREGQVHVRLASDGEVRIGGRCVTTVDGILDCEAIA